MLYVSLAGYACGHVCPYFRCQTLRNQTKHICTRGTDIYTYRDIEPTSLPPFGVLERETVVVPSGTLGNTNNSRVPTYCCWLPAWPFFIQYILTANSSAHFCIATDCSLVFIFLLLLLLPPLLLLRLSSSQHSPAPLSFHVSISPTVVSELYSFSSALWK